VGGGRASRGSIKTPVEVQALNRTFRSTDFRKLATYAVLYFGDRRTFPDALALTNPLRGTAIEVGIDEFFEDVAGMVADEALQLRSGAAKSSDAGPAANRSHAGEATAHITRDRRARNIAPERSLFVSRGGVRARWAVPVA